MTKKLKILLTALLMFSSTAFAVAINSEKINVTSIESRFNGHHDIHFAGAVPSQSCGLEDRAILAEETAGGKSMLSILLSALISDKKVIIRVDGCLDNRPNIVKVQIYQ